MSVELGREMAKRERIGERLVEIRRITDQSQPLEEFYREFLALGSGNDYSKIGSRMLDLLHRLRAINGPPIWAVTSHANLHFVSGDDYRLPVLVSVLCGGDWFYIEYRMSADEAPWPDAYVRAKTDDVERAGEMVAFGLTKATGVAHTIGILT